MKFIIKRSKAKGKDQYLCEHCKSKTELLPLENNFSRLQNDDTYSPKKYIGVNFLRVCTKCTWAKTSIREKYIDEQTFKSASNSKTNPKSRGKHKSSPSIFQRRKKND